MLFAASICQQTINQAIQIIVHILYQLILTSVVDGSGWFIALTICTVRIHYEHIIYMFSSKSNKIYLISLTWQCHSTNIQIDSGWNWIGIWLPEKKRFCFKFMKVICLRVSIQCNECWNLSSEWWWDILCVTEGLWLSISKSMNAFVTEIELYRY